jgi:hypothetical protein
MFKKLPGTSYRALFLALMALIVLVLLIAYDIWTGTIHSVVFDRGYESTWARDPVVFSFFIGLLAAIAALGILVWYVSLREAIKYHRKKASNSGRK